MFVMFSGHIRLKPGCNALQSLESEVNGILGRIRERCGQEAMNNLHYRNAPLTMAKCGSKGSPLNISQMISCLGQQSVGGSRIQGICFTWCYVFCLALFGQFSLFHSVM